MNKIPAIIFGLMPLIGIWCTSIPNIHKVMDKLETSKQSSFFSKHGKIISWIGNIFLFFWIGLWFYLSMSIPSQSLSKLLREGQTVSGLNMLMALSTCLLGMTTFIGIAGATLGFMSFFQYHITKTKRIVLLIVCLLPIILASVNLIIHHQLGPYSIDDWSIIKLGLLYSSMAWIVNSTTIILGKHIMTLGAMGMCKIIAPLRKHVL